MLKKAELKDRMESIGHDVWLLDKTFKEWIDKKEIWDDPETEQMSKAIVEIKHKIYDLLVD